MSFLDSKPSVERFPRNAMNVTDILNYIKSRRLQTLSDSSNRFYWDGNYSLVGDWAVVYELRHEDDEQQQTNKFFGIYLIREDEEKMQEWLKQQEKYYTEQNLTFNIVTSVDEDILVQLENIPHVVLDKPRNWIEYCTIEQYYGNKTAERSGAHMMNHIDEGIYILTRLGASDLAKKAYSLHPCIQGDADFQIFYHQTYARNPDAWDGRILMLTTEYRNIANAYLSHCPSREDFDLSPLDDVNTMLAADKIQNRKDFEIYHKGTHPKSDRLAEYFDQWLRRLGVAEEKVLLLSHTQFIQ
jgi:hypothetical protein